MTNHTPGVKTGTLLWLPIVLDDERFDAVETLLLVGLAEHVNDQDECFVGIDHLARRGRCGYSTAKRRLTALAKRGAIARERRRRDDGNLSVYSYRFDRSFFALPGLKVSHDQGSLERAMTRAHPDEPAEPPHEEPPHIDTSTQPGPEPVALVTDSVSPPATVDASTPTFDEFWETYPRRNGKRLRKAATAAVWTKLQPAERLRATIAAQHYAAATASGLTIACDADRFLRRWDFDDWQEPAEPDRRRANGRDARWTNGATAFLAKQGEIGVGS